ARKAIGPTPCCRYLLSPSPMERLFMNCLTSRKRRGIATIEFVAILPILSTLVLGMLEMSRAFLVKEILSDAARKGCQTGIQGGKSTSDITTDVDNILNDNTIPTTNRKVIVQVNDVTADASTANHTDKVSVKVTVPYGDVAWTPFLFLNASTIES